MFTTVFKKHLKCLAGSIRYTQGLIYTFMAVTANVNYIHVLYYTHKYKFTIRKYTDMIFN